MFQASRVQDSNGGATNQSGGKPPESGGAPRRGVWKLMKQGPRFATRTVEAKRECA
ncbi:hypothetical protein XAPC_2286 [Xanthomonas citri pv. punicae str. LMG 859]|nr:hypothetical protein XAPC_2286 [Xanthomonas citri pv. punicae str. LMG 859]